jgi:hypothetical protein
MRKNPETGFVQMGLAGLEETGAVAEKTAVATPERDPQQRVVPKNAVVYLAHNPEVAFTVREAFYVNKNPKSNFI